MLQVRVVYEVTGNLMNQTRNRRNIPKTCSCSSCVFKPKRELIRNGSKIDKLYYDQYLPLRERKLLDKLVRTRGVYDDIRYRILSLSSVDIANNIEFDDSQSFKSETDSEKSSPVHKLVDLVDRGEYPPLNSSVHLHSDCCGCCSCSSKTRIQKHKVHMHIPDPEHINRYVESHRGKMRKNIKQVGFGTARSDPCMCTLKFSKPPRKPKHVVKKYRSTVNVLNKPVEKKTKIDTRPINNKKCECEYEVVKPSLSKKSIVLLKNAETKVRDSIRSTVTKIENIFRIKKDSLMIFRDQLKKKQQMKAWECDPDFCVPYECNPDECYEKVMNKVEAKARHHHISHTHKEKKKHERKMPKYPFPRECEPFMCTPGDCDPRACSKILLKGSPTGHQLKRCFCTQKVNVKSKKQQKIKPKTELKVKKTSRTTMTKSGNKIICKCKVKDSVSTQTKMETLAKPSRKETIPVETVHAVQRKPHDLLPYECEPSFCVPGECNPLVCKERIKHRHHKNKIISKNTSIVEMPQKIRTRVQNHRKQTPKPKTDTHVADISKSAPNAPRKQAVRISSNFRFDIEFFKETNFPDAQITDTAAVRHREESAESNIEEYREQIKNKSLSDVKINHMHEQKNNMSVIPKPPSSIDQKFSQEPFLKRCFCTLKLHKTPKQKPKPKRPKSKITMTADDIKSKVELVICKCKKINVNEPDVISIKSQGSMTHSVVIPIKKPKTISKESNTEHKISTKTITSKSATSYSARKIQVQTRKKAKRKKEVTEPHTPYADKSKSAPNAPRRQAVKISSNFKFEIEFYKNKIPPNDDNSQKEEHPPSISNDKDIKEVNNKQRQRSIGEYQAPRKQEMEPQIKRSTLTIKESIKRSFVTLKLKKKPKTKVKKMISKKTMTTNSQPAKNNICECKHVSMSTQTKKVIVKPLIPQRPGLLPYECEPNFCIPGKCDPLICNERIKMRNRKEEDKEPLLKRCFCTLKFHNDNNAKGNRTVNALQANLEVNSVKSTGTDTNKIRHQKKGKHKLLPYECEPGVCEPGQCDPFQCLKLIKKRNMLEVTHRTKHANTESPKVKSASSRIQHVKANKAQNTKTKVRKEEEYVSKTEKPSVIPLSPAQSRQSVKLGSEFSFDIEFSKIKKQNEAPVNDDNRKVQITPKMGVKLTKRKSAREAQRHNNSIAQVSQSTKDKSLATKLEKCLCTLKLHKNGYRPHKQQIYFVNEIANAAFLKENQCEFSCVYAAAPCLCIATKLNRNNDFSL